MVGIIFFVILGALVVFIIVMGKFSFMKDDYKTYRVYTQNEIGGIGINTPVKYKGIVIGSISYIGFDETKADVVKIIVKIKNTIPIKKDSTLVMDSQGFAGLNYLSLKQSSNPQWITSQEDAVLNFKPNLLGRLSLKADEIGKESMLLLDNLKILLSKENMKSITQTLQSLDVLSENFKQTQEVINELAKNMNLLTKTLNKQVENGDYNLREVLNPFVLRLNTTLNHMDQFFKKSNDALDRFEKDPYNTIFGEQKK